MKKHWLLIKGTSSDKDKQWKQIAKYLLDYPQSKLTVYNSETNLFDKIFCLECNQSYNNLDLDVNSLSTSLHYKNRKPANISINPIPFEKLYNIYNR